MKIFKCAITGDEMFSDTYPIREENGFYVLKGKYVTRKGDGVDDTLLGANPSAEEASEDTEESCESGVNVLLDSRLKETGFGSKKDYGVYMKEYMTNVINKHKERGSSSDDIDTLKAEANGAFKEMYPKFKDLQFFSGASENPDGHITLMLWKDEEVDGVTTEVPYVYFYKIGMIAEKV